MRIVWRYNLIFVYDTSSDSKGLFYPRALMQLIVGLYLAEICLIGLLALNSAFGAMGMVVTLLVFTGLVHFFLSDAITPLLRNLPQTLSMEEDIQEEEKAKAARLAEREAANGVDGAGAAASYFDPEEAFGDEEIEVEDTDGDDHVVVSNRALEGASSIRAAITDWLKASAKEKAQNEAKTSGFSEMLEKIAFWTSKGQGDRPPGLLAKFLHPEEHEDFVALRKLLPKEDRPEIIYSENDKYCKYQPPELWEPKPILWIPRDDARVSRQEVAHTRLSTPITDVGATMNEKGRVIVDFDAAPFEEPRIFL